ncbi:FecR family protein [Pedobacter aquae]|uniref:FecR family protein n=1 Tax=Pedobacter aquae TaxID=2605747 RepID=A0A5C0VGS0_9SPHI|nr:FecR family protein [Pedobacter aquae]QEK51063.1 FecR family protein [Pedobacter aquae]
MKQEPSNAKDILIRYVNGQCTEEEKIVVEKWYKGNYDETFITDEVVADEHFKDVWNSLKIDINKNKIIVFRRIASIAASIAILLSVGIYYLWESSQRKQKIAIEEKIEILAGRNQASLTLNDGRTVYLDSIKIGNSIKENGMVITKMDDGTLSYKSDPNYFYRNKEAYNTISTPRGGQFKVVLPDNSIVWLNAASSIKFPVIFSDKKRLVELVGEGYFEVSHNKAKPFIVSSLHQETVVKGTKFNITSYPDEDKITTTLLEGAVVVKTKNTVLNETLLRPNEQVIVSESSVTKIKVDANESIAWKNGKFIFNNTPLKVIMVQLSRWYDVEVEYLSNVEKITFTGSISRFDNMQDVLRKISLTESVKFETRGRRIMVKH